MTRKSIHLQSCKDKIPSSSIIFDPLFLTGLGKSKVMYPFVEAEDLSLNKGYKNLI
jgi:hypothetical protein